MLLSWLILKRLFPYSIFPQKLLNTPFYSNKHFETTQHDIIRYISDYS